MPAVGTIRKLIVGTECPACGHKTCNRDVEVATGETLPNGYKPEKGEIVRNHWSECSACGWNQAS